MGKINDDLISKLVNITTHGTHDVKSYVMERHLVRPTFTNFDRRSLGNERLGETGSQRQFHQDCVSYTVLITRLTSIRDFCI